jgi:hypothetical protein
MPIFIGFLRISRPNTIKEYHHLRMQINVDKRGQIVARSRLVNCISGQKIHRRLPLPGRHTAISIEFVESQTWRMPRAKDAEDATGFGHADGRTVARPANTMRDG